MYHLVTLISVLQRQCKLLIMFLYIFFGLSEIFRGSTNFLHHTLSDKNSLDNSDTYLAMLHNFLGAKFSFEFFVQHISTKVRQYAVKIRVSAPCR